MSTIEKKIIVTGGAGFIGSYLCERLAAQQHHVICADNFSTGKWENISHLLKKKNFLVKETGTDIWVSVHYDSQKMHEMIDQNIALWQAAGISVSKNRYSNEWRKCYRLENGKPLPFHTNPKTAYDHCCQKRHCMTLLDNHLFMCPPAALFQYAYKKSFVGEEWKLAADADAYLAAKTQDVLAAMRIWKKHFAELVDERMETFVCYWFKKVLLPSLRRACHEKADFYKLQLTRTDRSQTIEDILTGCLKKNLEYIACIDALLARQDINEKSSVFYPEQKRGAV